MRKLGRFKGLEVFMLSSEEWQSMTTKDDEKFYVVGNNVFYHDVKVAMLNERGELCRLNEDEIIALRKRYDAIRAEARSMETSELDAKVAESPSNDAGDAQPQFDIDKFLKEGLFDVDGYIKNMLANDFNMEVEDIAVS